MYKTTKERNYGNRTGMNHAGGSVHIKKSVPSDWKGRLIEESAYLAAKNLLSGKKCPTAVLCTVDIFAIGAMRGAKELGLRVPEDISFVGIDDILLARYAEPKLTTVGIDKVHMGELAFDLLMQKMPDQNPQSLSLPMELIIRESVKDLTT